MSEKRKKSKTRAIIKPPRKETIKKSNKKLDSKSSCLPFLQNKKIASKKAISTTATLIKAKSIIIKYLANYNLSIARITTEERHQLREAKMRRPAVIALENCHQMTIHQCSPRTLSR